MGMNKEEFIDFYRNYRDNDNEDKHLSHEKYKEMRNRVDKIKIDLQNGNELSRDNYESFLDDLLYSFYPGISNAGKGRINRNEYEAMVSSERVLHELGEVIKCPNGETGEKLRIAIRDILDGHNKYLIVNRVLAACTSEVSSIVDRQRFSLVFKELVENNIIASCDDRCDSTFKKDNFLWLEKEMGVVEWYNENCYLISKIKEVIESIDGKKPEIIHLLTLPWKIWEEKLEFFYKKKVSPEWT